MQRRKKFVRGGGDKKRGRCGEKKNVLLKKKQRKDRRGSSCLGSSWLFSRAQAQVPGSRRVAEGEGGARAANVRRKHAAPMMDEKTRVAATGRCFPQQREENSGETTLDGGALAFSRDRPVCSRSAGGRERDQALLRPFSPRGEGEERRWEESTLDDDEVQGNNGNQKE